MNPPVSLPCDVSNEQLVAPRQMLPPKTGGVQAMPIVMFYHARPLAFAQYGEVRQVVDPTEPEFEAAYQWLEKQIGFYGLFLACGNESAADMTGYANQFSRNWVAANEPDQTNRVLFGYHDVPTARFSDYINWHYILNSVRYPHESPEFPRVEAVSDYIGRLVLKPSWQRSDWLRGARQEKLEVQAHVDSLDLTTADVVWCRNNATRRELIGRGFEADRIKVKRLKAPALL